MQVKKRLVSAFVTGVALIGGVPVTVYAADPVELVDDFAGEITISRISPDKGEMVVMYTDTGTDVDSPLKMTITFPNSERIPAVDEVGTGEPAFMSTYYAKTIFDQNAAKFVSGVEYTLTDTMFNNGVKLSDNQSGWIYYGMALTTEIGSVRTITGRVYYGDCMRAYQEGVECIANAAGEFKPWLDGVELEIPAEEEPGEPSEPEEPEEPSEPETPEEPSEPSEPETSSEPEEPAEEPSSGEETGESGGGGGAEEPSVVKPSFPSGGSSNGGTSGEMSGGGSSSGRTVASVATAAGVGNNFNAAGTVEDAAAEAEAEKQATTGVTATVKSGGTVSETPETGETEEQSGINFGAIKWWALIPAAIAGLGVAAWWLLPFGRKKRAKNAEN